MEGRKVLVTGGAGFLGSHLIERLCERNAVSVVDDFSAGSLRNLGRIRREVVVHKGSILDDVVLGRAMKGQDVMYHLAAKTSAAESVERPLEYWRVNVEGTVNVIRACVEAGVPRLVFASSAAVYGDTPANPKVETMKPSPASPYATTKMVGEFAFEEAGQMEKLEPVVLRIFNAYGPRQDPRSAYGGVVARFSAAVAQGRPVEIHGDGEQTRDFLFAADLAEAMELAGEAAVAGRVFNVGSGGSTRVLDVVRILSELTGTPIRTLRKEPRPGDVRHSQADITQAADALGFHPRTSLRDGLDRTLSYYRANPPE